MKQTAMWITAAALAALGRAPADGPGAELEAASAVVDRAWGATTREECRAAIEEVFADPMELYLTTEEFSGVLPREALLAMAEQLGSQGADRSWETEEESWILSEGMAVRKARERLREGAETRTVLTTSVFEREDGRWVLVHAHHSETGAGER